MMDFRIFLGVLLPRPTEKAQQRAKQRQVKETKWSALNPSNVA